MRSLFLFLLLLTGIAQAAVTGSAGHYRVSLVTDPPVVPVGPAELVLTVTAQGQPLEGAAITTFTQMPGMSMGERREKAVPVSGQPGVYRAPAGFPMNGAYTITVTIAGPHGNAEVVLQTSTGTDTRRGGGFPVGTVVLAALALALGVLVLRRVRATGQTVDLRPSRAVIGGLLLIAVMLAISVYAVKQFRRPGSMTPLEAQVMEMKMPAPLGVTPVELAEAKPGPLDRVVRYSGQAVAYEEQLVYPRTTGVLEWMPYYVGDAVKRGQELARLDVTQLEPRLAANRAAERMAEQARGVAEAEHRERRAAVEAAEAEQQAARAAAEAARARVRDAEAEVGAARADADYARNLLERSRELARQGAVSEEELQRDRAEAADAEARLRTAGARLAEARAGVREAEATLAARRAGSEEARAGSETGARRVAESEAGVQAARAQAEAAAAERGYADVVSRLDGVVTERLLSPGVLVQPGTPILRVAQINPIRLQANVAAADLAGLEAGARVRVRDARGRTVEGRITALRPAVDPGARQGMVEALVPNPDHRFLPGAYVAMEIVTERTEEALLVPSPSVQTVGNPPERYVWVAEESAGGYAAHRRKVTTGASDGTRTAVLSGLQPGDRVIAAGYQFLADGDPVAPTNEERPRAQVEGGVQTVRIEVSSKGFQPASLDLEPGVPARLTFVRVDEQNCGTEVFFPELGLQKKLPLNQPVVVEVAPRAGHDLSFTCGMNMLKGKVVVR